MSFFSDIKKKITGSEEVKTGKDMWDGAGKYAMGALDFVTDFNPITMALKGGYHTYSGVADAIQGDREGAVKNGSAAFMDGLSCLPPFRLARSALNVLSGTIGAATDTRPPTVDEAVASGANGVIDSVAGKAEKPQETTTAQKVLGVLGAAGTIATGPLGMIAGAAIGRKLGGLFG